MIMHRTNRIFTALVCLTLSACPAKTINAPSTVQTHAQPPVAKQTPWQRTMAAGDDAYRAGNYAEAEKMYKAGFVEAERFGMADFRFSRALHGLTRAYLAQGKDTAAEPLFQRALAVFDSPGPYQSDADLHLSGFDKPFREHGRHAKAEMLLKRQLAYRERLHGAGHRFVGHSLNHLAGLYRDLGRHDEAERLYERALGLFMAFGPMARFSPEITREQAWELERNGEILRQRGKLNLAEPEQRLALAIRKKRLGPMHPEVARSLNRLGLIYKGRGMYARAEEHYKKALSMNRRTLGARHPEYAKNLDNLASLYQTQKRYAEAEPLIKQAL